MELISGDKYTDHVIVSYKMKAINTGLLIFFFKKQRKTTGRVEVELPNFRDKETHNLKQKVQ